MQMHNSLRSYIRLISVNHKMGTGDKNMFVSKEKRDPYFWEAIISLLSLVAGIMLSIVIFGLDPHIPMILGIIVAAIVALRAGFSWGDIQGGMEKGITNAIPAILILLVIGILTA